MSRENYYVFLQVAFLLSSFIPMLYRFPTPTSLIVFFTMQFINIAHLFSITPPNYRQMLFYLPSLYIFTSLFSEHNAVKGMILLLLGIFSVGAYIADFSITDEKRKLFKKDGEKIMFLIQIIGIMIISVYMFTRLVPLVSIAKEVGYPTK